MKKPIRWFLVAVLVIDAMGAAFLVGAAQPPATPSSGAAPVGQSGTPDPEATPVDPSREALRMLGSQLAERSEQLRLREEELDELIRGAEVLRQAGLEDTTEPDDGAATGEEPEPDLAEEAFDRLSRAYENMEPDSAALALTELAGIDKEAVVQLLIGWRARVSGAILDALAQTNPVLAAELSYEIWKLSGKDGTSPASSGR